MIELDLSNLSNEERSLGRFLRLRAENDGDRPYLTFGDVTHTFGSTEAQSRMIARGMSRLGVGDGDRVMLLLPNCAEFVLSWFAASLLGAITVPVNTNLRGVLLDALISDSRPRILIIHETLVPALETLSADVLKSIDHLVLVGDPATIDGIPDFSPRASAFDEIRVAGADDPEIPHDFRRVQMVSYTSGTTGPSKGVVVSNAAAFCPALNIIKVLGIGREDTLYTPLPLFHGMSSRQGVVPTLLLGSHLVVDERFSASGYWRRAAECKATLGLIVHSLLPLCKVQPPGPFDRAHGIRAIFNGSHDREFEDRFGVHITEAFAMTETSHILCTPYPERKWGSTGRVHPDWEVRLVDPDGFPVPVNQPGELVARPRKPYIMMEEYLNKPAATLEAFRGLWFRTGDILREDEEGNFYFIDRKKDRIRRRGENISSADVEASVLAHPEIAECVAIPFPANDGEDEVRVVAVLKPGSDLKPADLSKWLEPRMPKFMRPRFLEFVASLPRTGTDKVEKTKFISQGLGPTAWDALSPAQKRLDERLTKGA